MGMSPLAEYDLDNVDCPICGNTGHIWWRDPEAWVVIQSKDCKCMVKRKVLRNMKKSGLDDLLDTYTLEKYKVDAPENARLLAAANAYLQEGTGWFFISGRPGSGKTHLCTGICNELLNDGVKVLYMIWRDEAVKLKYAVNDRKDDYYQRRMNQLKEVPVLYIDDLLKGSMVTGGDANVALELINARYNSKRRTIISTELSIESLNRIDEALGRRIKERAGIFCLTSPNVDWSFKAT